LTESKLGRTASVGKPNPFSVSVGDDYNGIRAQRYIDER